MPYVTEANITDIVLERWRAVRPIRGCAGSCNP